MTDEPKREPREWWVVVQPRHECSYAYEDQADAEAGERFANVMYPDEPLCSVVHVREVTKERPESDTGG